MSTTFNQAQPPTSPGLARGPQAVVKLNAGPNLRRELDEILKPGTDRQLLLSATARIAARQAHARYLCFFQHNHTGPLRKLMACGEFAPPDSGYREKDLEDVAAAALRRRQTTTKCLAPQQQIFGTATPIMVPDQPTLVLAALVSPGNGGLANHLAALDQAAAALCQWHYADALARLEWEAQAAAAIAELASKVQACDSIHAAALLAVNELQAFFECDQVSLGLTRKGQAGMELEAISGMSEFDRASDISQRLRAALDEAFIRKDVTAWPPLDESGRHATLAHRDLGERLREEAILSAPLHTIDEEAVGAVLLTGTSAALMHPRARGALSALTPHLGTALRTRRQADPGRLHRAVRAVCGEAQSRRRKLTVALLCGVMILLPATPWPHRVKSECRIEPVIRRFAAAPYDGLLKTSLVRPGQLVVEGQPLAQMDDRELRWELSKAMAELGRAAKKRDVAMAAHDTPEAQMAELEMQRLEQQIELLQNRQDHLEITSPLGGVILKGDLEDAEGAPVKVGQTLFEIAPLDPVKLELSILENDLPAVIEGQRVHARLQGYRGGKVHGQIALVYPQSEIVDAKNVFLAEVELQNPTGEFRPGMSGTAYVSSGWHPLGWIWFHQAWHRTRVFLGI